MTSEQTNAVDKASVKSGNSSELNFLLAKPALPDAPAPTSSAQPDPQTGDTRLPLSAFPERDGEKTGPNLMEIAFLGRRQDKIQGVCEVNAFRAIRNSFPVKMLISALESNGCEFDLRRHLSCERCASDICGGYDPKNNQVVLCNNNTVTEKRTAVTLAHELIHMFDNCRASMDFNDLEHLACTEIRAANLIDCNFPSYFAGTATQGECVREHAARSMEVLKGISVREAMPIIDKVFDRCMGDLEPFGRRFLWDSGVPELIYQRRRNYGYY